MFVYGADFFLYKPGLVLLALGLLLTLPLSLGPVTLGPITFSLHWMLLGLALAILGLQCVYMGILSQVFFDYSGAITAKWFRRFPYNRTRRDRRRPCSATGSVLGGHADGRVHPERLPAARRTRPSTTSAIIGLLLAISGFMTFTFTLLLHSTAVAVQAPRRDPCGARPPARAAERAVDRLRRLAVGAADPAVRCPTFAGSGSATSAAATRRRSRGRCSTRSAERRARRRGAGRRSRRALRRVRAIEGRCPRRSARSPSASLDVVLLVSVARARERRRRGCSSEVAPRARRPAARARQRPVVARQAFLELSAFRLGLSPARCEMDDHKTLLRRARFVAACWWRRAFARAHSLLPAQARAQHLRGVSGRRTPAMTAPRPERTGTRTGARTRNPTP